ncbi:OstA-like protein [Blattabacterium cuenoti]|uniref:OstA-like protein n=1 Tax=Blattabacterium cuenoti TaxID=1653831 RepID=UPI00163B8CBD|nr:OstA-like protein [Blattabacterium cuenoti]
MKNFFFLCLLNLVYFYQVFSQEKKEIKLIHADFIHKNEKKSKFFIIGNVHFKYKKYHLFCDKAVYYKKNDIFHGYGNIQFKSNENRIFSQEIECSRKKKNIKITGKVVFFHHNIKITSNSIIYNYEKKIFQAIKNVVLHFKNEMKLSTNILEYNIPKKFFIYKNGGSIFHGNCTIFSERGMFFPTEKKAEVKYNVKLLLHNYTILSNSIEYLLKKDEIHFISPTVIEINKTNNFFYIRDGFFFPKKEVFLSKKYCIIHYNGKIVTGKYFFLNRRKKIGYIKNVIVEEKNKKTYFFGDEGYFDFVIGLFSFRKNSFFIKIFKNNFFYIHSDIINVYIKNNNVYLIKVLPVKSFFLNENIQGISDYMEYKEIDKSIKFIGKPFFWIKNQQFNGDTVFFHLKKDFFLDSLKILKNSLYIKKINSIDFNQIQGETMIGFFQEENKLKKFFVKKNVKSIIYIYSSDKENKIINKSSCEFLSVNIEKGKEINKISCLDNTTSEVFFLKKESSTKKDELKFFLPNFSWKEKEKPKNKKNFLLKKIKKYKKENIIERKKINKIKKIRFL